jgi:hypothetical protein
VRIRAISGRISTRALASIEFSQHKRRVSVSHRYDPLIASALHIWACDELPGVELLCGRSYDSRQFAGFEFKSIYVADFFCELCRNYRWLGEWLVAQGRTVIC